MEKPPVWEAVCNAFGIRPAAYFTYGNAIYCVDVPPPPPDIIEHERVHMSQQSEEGMTPELWWGKFLRDPVFRVEQEAEAYGRQYAFLYPRIKDRNVKVRLLHSLAMSLSGPLYNNVIGVGEASNLIQRQSGIKI